MSNEYYVDPQLSSLLRGMGAPKNMPGDWASVLDDVTLPDMDGWEEGLIRVLREECSSNTHCTIFAIILGGRCCLMNFKTRLRPFSIYGHPHPTVTHGDARA